MQLNVAHLLKGVPGSSQAVSLDASFDRSEDTNAEHVHGRIRLVRLDGGIWVTGQLNATVSCSCSRCLRNYSFGTQLQLDDIYYPVVAASTGTPLTLPPEADPSFTIDDHHILDLSESVRQSIILATPMKPLCQKECAGICSECGINRNEATCACQDQEINSSWAPLLNLSL
ncbi:MAG: DUF177 domain-containing protein [Dehalococcoidia bacterium]